ncbi:antibiotic biosynthesis monooxygenase [Luedemannella flava]
MPFIRAGDGYLAVFNMFTCNNEEEQQRIVDEMKEIVDNADYPGWVSSTVHAAVDSPGTANYVQWRSRADLEARYAGAKYQQGVVPLFQQIATSVRLLKTEAVFVQHHRDQDFIEIGPHRDDYTVIIVMECAPENQQALVDALGQRDDWLMTVPGYRAHAICRGSRGRSSSCTPSGRARNTTTPSTTCPSPSGRPRCRGSARSPTPSSPSAGRTRTGRCTPGRRPRPRSAEGGPRCHAKPTRRP